MSCGSNVSNLEGELNTTSQREKKTVYILREQDSSWLDDLIQDISDSNKQLWPDVKTKGRSRKFEQCFHLKLDMSYKTTDAYVNNLTNEIE